MINISGKKIFNKNHIHCLFLLGILECMIIVQVCTFDLFFSKKSAEPLGIVQYSISKTPEPSIETEFAYQIKQAESLYNQIIFEAASLHDVELTMVRAIIMAESGYNKISVSGKGASGLMQLMPNTAKSLGVKDILNPEENIHAGVRYYKSLLERFDGDEMLALAAYNSGATNVRRHKGIPPFQETRRYINRVLEYQHYYKHGTMSETETSQSNPPDTRSL